MANRYPLIIDATNKKLKELPIGDSLLIDGNAIVNGIVIDGVELSIEDNFIKINGNNISIEYTQIVDQPFIPSDLSDLTDNQGLLTTSDTDLVGVSIFGNDSTLLVDAVNSSIPYSVLSGTPFIPTDISQLSDVQGLLGDGSTISGPGANTFIELIDTPFSYEGNSNKFLRVNPDGNGLEFIDFTLDSFSITEALGYTPYDGDTNPEGFINQETDTLDSVLQRGNTTNTPMIIGSLTANDTNIGTLEASNLTIKNSLEFFSNGEISEFNVFTEENTILNIAGFLIIDDVNNTISVSGDSLISTNNTTLGNGSSFWNKIFVTEIETNNIFGNNLGSESNKFNSVHSENIFATSIGTEIDAISNIRSSNITSNDIFVKDSLEFNSNGETSEFNIRTEANTILNIAGAMNIDSGNGEIVFTVPRLLSSGNSSIGTESQPWASINVTEIIANSVITANLGNQNEFVSNLYADNATVGKIINKTNQNIEFDPSENVTVSLKNNKKFGISGVGTLRLPRMTTAERNTLTPEFGDIIFNFSVGTVQIYVPTVSWAGDPPQPVPGWVNLYTPPPPPT